MKRLIVVDAFVTDVGVSIQTEVWQETGKPYEVEEVTRGRKLVMGARSTFKSDLLENLRRTLLRAPRLPEIKRKCFIIE